MIFMTPFLREFMLYAGGVIDAARHNARAALDAGRTIVVVPGGAEESRYGGPSHNAVFLKNRTGFVRLALETGAAIVPTYTFGENEIFSQYSESEIRQLFGPTVARFCRKWQDRLGFVLPILKNWWPRSAKGTLCVGLPIHVERVENPTEEQVRAVHAEYLRRLEQLFNKYAAKYEPDEKARKLHIH
jgi:hypothetical protein